MISSSTANYAGPSHTMYGRGERGSGRPCAECRSGGVPNSGGNWIWRAAPIGGGGSVGGCRARCGRRSLHLQRTLPPINQAEAL